MIQTMVQMKEAILNLNVYDISNHFEKVLLTHGDITPLEEILPILQTIKKTSEWMSCDKEVRNDFALVRIKSLFLTLRKEIQKDAGSHSYKAFLNKALDLLTEKFPLEGAKISALALGHLFNPVVRGSLLPDDLKEIMINLLIEEHESTLQFRENKLAHVEPELLFEPSDDPCEENMAELLNTSLAAQGSLSLSSMEIEPLRSEFNDYALLPRVGTNTDILEWWRNNEKVIPMLAKIERGVLAIPPTSSSSERAFSTAGKLLTKHRHNLNPKTTEKMIYINKNYDHLKDLVKGKWYLNKEDVPAESLDDISESEPSSATNSDSTNPGRSSDLNELEDNALAEQPTRQPSKKRKNS